MNKIFIGNGKVSKIIRKKGDIVLDHKDIEIKDLENILKTLKQVLDENSVVINTAAKINLEDCEKNKNESFLVNTLGPLNLIEVCSKFNAKLVHISSGCIYDGNEIEFNETTSPKPAAWYTRTKTWADETLMNYGYENLLILRPRQLISSFPYPTNMLTKFLGIKHLRCIDEQNSLTCIEDLGDMLEHLLSVGASGIFNVANTGTISPYEIAVKLKEIDKDLIVEKTPYEEYLKGVTVKRVNTILDLNKLIGTGYTPRSCKEALDYCVKNYGKRNIEGKLYEHVY